MLPKGPLTKSASAAQVDRDAVPQPPLPDTVAHALDALNTAQEAYDMAHEEIAELRYRRSATAQVLTAVYSTDSDLEPFDSQAFNLGQFISDQALHLLNDKLTLAGSLTLVNDVGTAEGAVTATLALSTGTLRPRSQPTRPLRCRCFSASRRWSMP